MFAGCSYGTFVAVFLGKLVGNVVGVFVGFIVGIQVGVLVVVFFGHSVVGIAGIHVGANDPPQLPQVTLRYAGIYKRKSEPVE